MATVPDNHETVTNFTREPASKLRTIKKDGEPLVLTAGGKAKYIIQDAATYRKLLDALDRAEAIAGIRRGLKDVEAGRTQSLAQFRAQQSKKHGLRD
jgi:PHD/YefM family antitoxin component YafN of YafNO toxin-antitoxin module